MSVGPWMTKWMQEREAENAAGMEEILRHPASSKWLLNLIGFFADASTFDKDPLLQSYLQGRRSIGMDIRETAQKTNFELYYRRLCEQQHSARTYLAAQQNDADKVPFPKEK